MLKLLPLLLLTEAVVAFSGNVQQSICDPALKEIIDSPRGYHLRGDRCEGIYVKDVGGTVLQVVALIESFDDFEHASNNPLIIQWVQWDKSMGANPVRLRAEGLRRRSYYRMDTVRPADSVSFTWPSDVLSAEKLERQDVGVTAATQATVGGVERNMYLPVRISQHANASRTDNYKLFVMPGVELEEVYISLGPVGSRARPQVYIKNNEPLHFGYYPSGRAVMITVPELTVSGVYYIQVGAQLRGGGSTTVELWFFHDGH
jgi:hypothetical protein